ncbi:MAG TPA: T9SS type A sorting domain-containing protein, partial [Flavobacteriales bacterium]|nr:T9SS type A sorting domain-containing protein [Flavobacteriales bacterium]
TYTQSGTYTSVNGCATEILVLTITPSTSNTTTVSECDSYTWSVNGQTYTQSGTYTSVNGCATEILVLTILQGGTNTTTESACDSYTWSVNGQTYTQSGTYTAVTGCSTEILVLTITPSTSNTTTESACDSYTWSVNGQTYTQNGTYTSVNGCSTEVLVLTITPTTTNTTTENTCSSYTWPVNGQTYTQSGTYTSVSGCVTEVLVLTVSIPGTACNDGNPGTINDVLDANCNCVGTSTGCTENITLNITLDAFGSQTTWSLLQQGTSAVVDQGGPYLDGAAGSVIIEEICVPAGCYRLVVNDAAGDGINGGGYVLRTSGSNGQRIIDNSNNGGFASTSAIIGNGGFCLPLGTDKLIFTSCDKLDWISGQYLVASENAAVSAEWGVGDQSDDGYEFWIFDPNGTYGYARFRSHAVGEGYPAAGPLRATHMKINNWNPNQIPANVLMNVRVRSRVNGVNSAWGPACRFKIDPIAAACPATKLVDQPGVATFSCGVTRNWGGSSRLWARAVSGATQYQFRFESSEIGTVVRTTTTQVLQLNWNPALPNGTYSVQVRAFVNGQWCATNLPWGDACNVTIMGSPVSGQSLVLGGASTEVNEASLVLFPNPNNGQQLTVSLSAVEEGVKTVSVDIFDMNGARVSAQVIGVNDGMLFEQVAVNELASGLYMVNITAGDKRYTERLVINK